MTWSTLLCTSGALLAACGGTSTEPRNPVDAPPAVPNADVGQRRAAQEAAITERERASTQKRTDAQLAEQAKTP